MTPREIKAGLTDRGITLNRGATQREISDFSNFTSLRLSAPAKSIYEEFNGFPPGVMDSSSSIRIWTLQDVCSNSKAPTDGVLEFADFLMCSNTFSTNLSLEGSPVIGPENQMVAADLSSFLQQLIEGKFDYL